jgi:hypothetical protein
VRKSPEVAARIASEGEAGEASVVSTG